MDAAAERLEFAPPAAPGRAGALVLALLAHLALLVVLGMGVKWKRDTVDIGVEAELWASVPQQAAPPEVAPPPPPPPPPPQARSEPKPEPLVQKDADIALQKEKERKAQEQRERELEQQKQKDAAKKAEERAKLEARKKAEEQERLEAQKLAAEKKRKDEADRKRKQEADEKRMAQIREENLQRMAGLAGATGAPSATGNALQSAGPSAGWAGRVRARVKPNIVFTDTVPGNPEAHVEVRLSPDGTIIGKRITRPSGVKSWDEAVLRALDKTEMLPRDTDGRVPTPVELVFRPKD